MPDDPLASWSDGPTKATLLDFIARVTKEGTADFVPPEERIATFDNDGTLWPKSFRLRRVLLAAQSAL